eukprot:5654434-Pyramimonas_sp.AAC.1
MVVSRSRHSCVTLSSRLCRALGRLLRGDPCVTLFAAQDLEAAQTEAAQAQAEVAQAQAASMQV